jgi:hypothetical protein
LFCRIMRRLPEQREPAHMRDVQQHQLALHRLCSTAHGHREGRVGRLGSGTRERARVGATKDDGRDRGSGRGRGRGEDESESESES